MTNFNRTHYRTIAAAIKASRAKEQPSLIPASSLIRLLCFYFHLDNPKFNEDAFRKSCGEES